MLLQFYTGSEIGGECHEFDQQPLQPVFKSSGHKRRDDCGEPVRQQLYRISIITFELRVRGGPPVLHFRHSRQPQFQCQPEQQRDECEQ